MPIKSVMTHQVSQVPKAEIQRSSFDRSHGYKTTFNSGYLIPFYCDEALPGDTFNLNATLFGRLATPLKPFMDNLFLETFFFSVPVRQIWDNWEKFNGEQTDPGDSTDFLVPQISGGTSSFASGSIGDYMGIPIGLSANNNGINSLHFRAFNHIFNNWFRDQNLVPSRPVPTGDGPDASVASEFVDLPRRRKRPDYFTSCLPWPQKTNNPITVPLSGDAPVTIDIAGVPTVVANWLPSATMDFDTAGPTLLQGTDIGAAQAPMFADLSQATGISIADLRQSFQIQKIYERDARGGTRYPEILRSHFQVTDPQMLVLQRPEFLGGGSQAININPVQQNTSDIPGGTTDTPLGNLSAYGTVTSRRNGFTKSFTEHCVLIGILNVRADLTYQQGINRMWSRQTRFDYFWPALAHLSEQAVLNKELFADGTGNDDLVFGYQERYAEYRYKPSLITGLMRSAAPLSLDIWHLSQQFGSLPTLNQTFIEDEPPIPRVIAVQTEPEFLLDAYINLRCVRPMPVYSVPGLIDHF